MGEPVGPRDALLSRLGDTEAPLCRSNALETFL